ncbi:MAG: cobalamin B12-binding domain-containing protein [Rhodospirillales bacterium]|nr:cobalamin B12-binding domain-containing protein [Rhodospirillales bacterium]
MNEADRQSNGKTAGRDRPWLMRTYAGHSTAAASNALYRKNLEKGQTGLSIAFDLPTQTGYDSDHILARGEVGKVGVPVGHIGDMQTLLAEIPLDRMNTSMTINATAPWLLALYIAVAERRGLARKALSGTTQNDVIKEYLSRGTYIFPPAASLKMTADVIAFTLAEVPRWNPVNVCSYHLQEAGATPVQELAYALATAIAVLDSVKASGQVPDAVFPKVVGRISFFVNAGLRFVTELCKMRAFTRLWDRICRERYGVEDPALRRFRYGVQVNSLGLTEQQPENNVYRILIEMLAVTLSRDARARAVQLPAWNEALGLPRPWDQQWSLRLQQIMAFETDLLEYGDIFDGAPVIEEKVTALCGEAEAELARIEAMGGAVAAVENAAMKRALVESAILRTQAVESGEMTVVGVNAFTQTEPSPLTADAGDSGTGDAGSGKGGAMTVDPAAEAEQIEGLKAWRAGRDSAAAEAALNRLESVAAAGGNVMAASIACAHAGVTTGEWGAALRRVLGEYRAPTGIGAGLPAAGEARVAGVRGRIEALTASLGRRPKMLVGKPGLDGHSNGAEQVAVRARDCGFEVVYEGIRLTPEEIVNAALEEGVHVVGLSILSGSHLVLVQEILRLLRDAGLAAVPVVVGGIVPPEDAAQLRAAGVAAVYTPKDFDLTAIMADIAGLLEDRPAAA